MAAPSEHYQEQEEREGELRWSCGHVTRWSPPPWSCAPLDDVRQQQRFARNHLCHRCFNQQQREVKRGVSGANYFGPQGAHSPSEG